MEDVCPLMLSRYRLLQLSLSISLALLIICLAVELTLLFTPLYYVDVHFLDIPAQSGFSYDRIIENYHYMIRYLLNPLPETFRLPSLPYSQHGQLHFADVKRIFTAIEVLTVLSGAVSMAGIYINSKARDFFYLRSAAILLTIFSAAPLIAFALDFGDTFILFHKLFFRNNYWIFDARADPVITILPEAFFLHAALLVIGLILIGILLLTFFYKKLSKPVFSKQNPSGH
jgi:integral membrane protein (TIGR01906 family)